ncbi:MAG: zinc ribbon domain-containing protein [Eubacterium sp.]|nr:zinc ribbon domain-containing protein [Eubacterium sp.]
MKYCTSCGAENGDENRFCFNCRCESFTDIKPAPTPPAANAPEMQAPPRGMPLPPPVYVQPPKPKMPLGIFELLTILGFVCSIVGMFSISMILHPLGAITSIIGFVQGKRFKAIALAGTVISIVGGIVYTVISLYQNGLLPEWITFGAFH